SATAGPCIRDCRWSDAVGLLRRPWGPRRRGRQTRTGITAAARRPAARRPARRIGIGQRHRFGPKKGHIDPPTSLTRAGFRRADQRLELAIRQLNAIKFIVELADDDAQILLVD